MQHWSKDSLLLEVVEIRTFCSSMSLNGGDSLSSLKQVDSSQPLAACSRWTKQIAQYNLHSTNQTPVGMKPTLGPAFEEYMNSSEIASTYLNKQCWSKKHIQVAGAAAQA